MRKKGNNSEKSISDIISTSFNRIMSVVVIGITIISMFVLITGQYSACTRDFDSAAGLASARVYWALQSYKNIVQDIGAIPLLSDPNTTTEEKQKVLSGICELYNLVRCKTVNADGYSDMDVTPIYRGDRAYFQQAMLGKTYIQEPVTSRTDGQLAIIGAAPVWDQGKVGGDIVGVVFISINPIFIHDIIEGVDISENTFAYIIDSTGTTVAASDMKLVYEKNNNIKKSENDSSLRSIAEAEQRMINGETGSATVKFNGDYCYLSYTPIAETPGWSIAICSPYKDYIDTPILLMILMGECLLISIFIVKIRAKKIADEVTEPVRRMTESIKRAAESGTEIDQDYEGSKDVDNPIEMKIISEAMGSIMDRLDLATSDTRQFLDAAVITDLVSMDMLKYIHGYYNAAFGVNVIVADSKGTVLVGHTAHGLVDANALREDESASFIMLNDRVIGSTIFKIPEECILNKQDAQQHAIYVSKILEMVAFGNFRRSLQGRNQMKHAKAEIERMTEYHVEIGEEARRMAAECERVRKVGNVEALKEITAKFITFCYDIVSRTDDFTAYNESNSLAIQIKEEVYLVEDLVNDIKNDLQRMHPKLGERINIRLLLGMPDALFGDRGRIRKLIENLLFALSDEYDPNDVGIYFESKKNSYATCLSISIHGNRSQTEKERKRLKSILEGDIEGAGIVDGINASELKLISISRVVKRMNGSIAVNKGGDGETWCTVVIPQLEVDPDDK